MSKPTHWVVIVTDSKTGRVTEHPFTERHKARGFAIVQKAQGHAVEIKAKGY